MNCLILTVFLRFQIRVHLHKATKSPTEFFCKVTYAVTLLRLDNLRTTRLSRCYAQATSSHAYSVTGVGLTKARSGNQPPTAPTWMPEKWPCGVNQRTKLTKEPEESVSKIRPHLFSLNRTRKATKYMNLSFCSLTLLNSISYTM